MTLTPIGVLLFLFLFLILIYVFYASMLMLKAVIARWKDGCKETEITYPSLDAEEWVRRNTIDRYCPICGHDLVMVKAGEYRCDTKACDVSQVNAVLLDSTETMGSTEVENEA